MRMQALLATALLSGQAMGQGWWWPPQNPMEVQPECVSPGSPVSITLSGVWHDACKPNVAELLVNGNVIEYHVIRDPPPGFCLSVLTAWSLTGSVGPLPPGTYSVYATYYVSGQAQSTRDLMGTFDVEASCGSACYPNCDNSTTAPILNIQDFSCFLNSFASGETYANCDGSTTPPVLNVQDFSCFLNSFAVGCS